MNSKPITETDVLETLQDFLDPELGRSIVKLGQVQQVRADGGRLSVVVGLPTFAAPVWEELRSALVEKLRTAFPHLEQVEVVLTPWARPPERQGVVGLSAKSVAAVGSGKGGVGKSTVAALLAQGLARAGAQVGLLDADVYGPSIPHLLGVHEQPTVVNDRLQPVRVDGLAVMSIGFFVPPGEAVLWRGPMLHNAISQFLRDTDWGDLDYLIIDLPPGTGDVALSLSQLLPLTEAVVVCTPQDVALLDAAKAITMFRKLQIEILGMVENMSYFICPGCGMRHEIFGCGGARRRAAELNVPFLGEIPLNVGLRTQCDEGRLAAVWQDTALTGFLETICRRLVHSAIQVRRQKAHQVNLPVLE
ncbi:MAG TPA: Mrp/NBP35 family ATP-binding protein [Thermoguttaceae bacterium]|nr:Mrp/NBP35 family ATP-binding protein [Thermoguttaceae bacterium]HPP53430.1 Mrp/NBP35 family ATP-binding protein [Thermoguttaceae bacterium]